MSDAYRLPDGRLEEGFEDRKPLFTESEARFEANRCLYCFDAPCIPACPTAIDIPTFIRKIATGNLRGSARTILEANLLGMSCARACPVEVLCEGSCVYVGWGRPAIAIGRLQRYAMAHGASAALLDRRPSNGHSIGLIGAGPASLACAGTLARLGHEPVIYEQRDVLGGLNTIGIAPYKLPANDALDDVRFVAELGVTFRTRVTVGQDVTIDELLARHEAVFLGVGLGADRMLEVPGAGGPGVVGAVEWIESMKTDPAASVAGVSHAVVIGGGNTAVDVVRELRGLGVDSVTLVYRRDDSRLSAYRHELDAARREGVRVLVSRSLGEVVRSGSAISAVRLVHTEDGAPTDRDAETLPADLVVWAIGQSTLRELAESCQGVRVDARGRVLVDGESFVTGNPRVYAGGDAINGGKEVVNAVHDGQAAARAMHAALTGEHLDG